MEPPNQSSLHPRVEAQVKPFLSKAVRCFLPFPLTSASKLLVTVLCPSGDTQRTSVPGEVALHLQQQRTPGPQRADARTWVIRPRQCQCFWWDFQVLKAKCANKRFTELNLSASQLWHCRAGMHPKFLKKDVLHPQHLCEGKCSYSYFFLP